MKTALFNNEPVTIVRKNSNGTTLISVNVRIDGFLVFQTIQRTVRTNELTLTTQKPGPRRVPFVDPMERMRQNAMR